MQEIVVLLCAPTKFGKTTLSMSLMSEDSREVLSRVSDERTNITVDWIYSPDAEEVEVVKILLNTSNVYRFSASEKVVDNKLVENFEKFLGVSDLGSMSSDAMQECVDVYLSNCEDKGVESLARLLHITGVHNFIQRVRVKVQPNPEFAKVLSSKDVSLVLRDTRGFLDTEVTETRNAISNRSAESLGLDGIDSAIVLATATETPNALIDYKNSFGKVLESVPVFCILRDPSVGYAYEGLFSDYTDDCFEVFWDMTTKLRDKLHSPLKLTYRAYYNFLQLMGIGVRDGATFKYNYEVYDHSDLEYFCSDFHEAYESSDGASLYEHGAYKLYAYLILKNITCILDMTLEHLTIKKSILSGAIMRVVKRHAQKILVKANTTGGEEVALIACQRNPGRDGVCKNIRKSPNILGERGGITAYNYGTFNCPGALGSAVATFEWLWELIKDLPNVGELVDSDGNNVRQKMSKEHYQNLIKMYLLDHLRNCADPKAMYNDYFLVNRLMTRDAILEVRKHSQLVDAVDDVAYVLIDMIFKTN